MLIVLVLKCNSSLKVKNGKRKNGIQEYKCKECGTKFTAFTNTILEKTRWHWDIWIKVLEMTINNLSIKKMVNILENDYGCTNINEKTVWLWRMKLIHSIATLPMPKKDIEQIFEEILTAKVNYTVNDIKTKELDLPKPSGKYMNILVEETKKVREITRNKYFKFNEEDGVVTFNKREYLLDIPRYKLYTLCKEYNIKRFRRSIVTLLLKQSDIDIKIYQLLEKDRYLRNSDI